VTRTKKALLTIIAVLLSSGWILPAWLSAHEWMRFSEQFLIPNSQIDSFPHAELSEMALTVTAIWLALAISFWVIIVLGRLWRRQNP
jgi:hypothetical protein